MHNLPCRNDVMCKNVTMSKHLTRLVTSLEQIINTSLPANNQKD